jgi:hypothetical protein
MQGVPYQGREVPTFDSDLEDSLDEQPQEAPKLKVKVCACSIYLIGLPLAGTAVPS